MLFRFLGKSRFFSVFVSGLTIFLIAYTTLLCLRNLIRLNTNKKGYSQLTKELKMQEQLYQQNQEKMALIKTNEFWVLEAKKKLGYIQAGEHVYKFYTN